jgi:hypothetical protein
LNGLETILRGHRQAQGKGLPIGSIKSQHLANFYLNALDRFCQNHSCVRVYARYMNDFICWGNDRRKLKLLGIAVEEYLPAPLGLQLRPIAITAFVLPMGSYHFRRQVMTKLWSEAIGHQSGKPARQLEQHHVHHEQQRHSCCPQVRPLGMDFQARSKGLNRPLSGSSPCAGDDKMPHEPPCAGSPAEAGSNAPSGSQVSLLSTSLV